MLSLLIQFLHWVFDTQNLTNLAVATFCILLVISLPCYLVKLSHNVVWHLLWLWRVVGVCACMSLYLLGLVDDMQYRYAIIMAATVPYMVQNEYETIRKRQDWRRWGGLVPLVVLLTVRGWVNCIYCEVNRPAVVTLVTLWLYILGLFLSEFVSWEPGPARPTRGRRRKTPVQDPRR